MSKEKMKYLQKFFCIVLCLIFFCSFASCSKKEEAVVFVPPHRLEWWLDDIEWNSDRIDVSGKNVRIAIIDCGVDTEHPDIKDSIEKNIKISSLEQSVD